MKLDATPRTRHDNWTKDALALWLGSLGTVQLDARIAGATRRADVLFSGGHRGRRRRTALGMLGEIACGCVLFEPFRNPVTPWELETCIVKCIEHMACRLRAARRAKRKQSSVEHSVLCVITPSASVELKTKAELTLLHPDKPGLYRMATLLHVIVVVVDELSPDPSTLWLRLLGRDKVQGRAIHDLLETLGNDPLADATLHLLVAWRQNVPHSVLTNYDRDEVMNWQRVYEKWEQKTLKKGKAEGKAEGRAEALLIILDGRGLSLTATQRKQILACKDLARLDQWLHQAHLVADVKQLFNSASPPRRRTPSRAA